MDMPAALEWVIIAIVVLMLVAAAAIVAVALAWTKRPATPVAAQPQQLALPDQLQQADQLLAAGRIDPAEHAAMRNRILGLTD